MTNEEILDAYLGSLGLTRKRGNSLEVLLPFLLMDQVYQMYEGRIAKLNCRFGANHWKKQWRLHYNKLNGDFFGSFREEQKSEVIDWMDRFETYIGNHMMVTRCAVLDLLKPQGRTLDSDQVAADCLLSEVLCWAAADVWKHVLGDFYSMPKVLTVEALINAVRYDAHHLVNLWYRPTERITMSDDPKCSEAITILCRRSVNFLMEGAR